MFGIAIQPTAGHRARAQGMPCRCGDHNLTSELDQWAYFPALCVLALGFGVLRRFKHTHNHPLG